MTSSSPSSKFPSPEKRRCDTINGRPASPLLSKRKRVASAITNDQTQNSNHNLPTADSALYAFSNPDGDSSDNKVVPFDADDVSMLGASYLAMDDETHTERLTLREGMMSGKGTERAYPRHIKNYVDFMISDQAERLRANSKWKVIPPFPITARNVAAFLKYETTREKCGSDGQPISDSRVGVSGIKQCISALEHWRHNNEHKYTGNPEALRPLRDDTRITTYEANARATEPQRLEKAQTAKALGTVADTYTQDEVIRCSMWCLQFDRGTQQVHVGIRDRSMLLLSASTAFRGDNTRGLLWSDLSARAVPMVDIAPGATAMALVLFSNQGKTNTEGRIDEQGAFRHRLPELCPVGGLGFYFFSHFHIIGRERPTFMPDFSQGGEIGSRAWYKIFLFPGADGASSEMTYENHRKRVLLMYERNGVTVRKVTHAGRPFAATTAREHRASEYDTKALGNWSQGGSMRACYDRALPVDALLAAASFNARKHESFFIARDLLEPPESLVRAVFPWIEEEQEALKKRYNSLGRHAGDLALSRFLILLAWLRRVVLQDAAVLCSKYPSCSLLKFAPFNTPEFASFSSQATVCIQHAEEEAQQQLSRLPETVAASLHGIVTTNQIQQERVRDEIRQENLRFGVHLHLMDTMIRAQLLGSNSKRRKAATTIPVPTFPITPLYPPPSTSVPAAVSIAGTSSGTATTNEPQPIITATQNNFALHATTAMTISLSGKPYPATTFLLSADSFERDRQLTHIATLETHYSANQLAKHQFEWIRSTTESQSDEWLPIYMYWKPKQKNSSPTITQIWDEWAYGMDGQLSVMQLTATWGARWRRNNSAAKTEASRRKKIVSLIETLSTRPNWNVERALKFLSASFPIPMPSVPYLKSTRMFIDRLQKQDGQLLRDILQKADSYAS